MRIWTLCGRHLTPEHLVTSLSVEWCRIFDLQSKRHWQGAYSFPQRYRLPQSPIRIQTPSDNASSLREALLPSLHSISRCSNLPSTAISAILRRTEDRI